MISYHRSGAGRATGSFLPGGTAGISLALKRSEQRRKRAMLACFATQRAVLTGFATAVERYRAAPDYDFTRPPHPGRLYYEGEAWGIAGALWREHAASALAELGIAAP
jgi:hypothetical protein